MEPDIFALTRGTAPLLVSVPHAGVHIPGALERRMTPAALQRALKSIGKEDFRVSFSGGTLASIISILAGSDALTVLPYSVVFLTRKTLGVEALRLKIEHPDRQLGLLTFDGTIPPPALKQFAGFLKDEFALLEARIQHESQVTQRRG